jgi:hypothetical protein
MTIEKTRTFLLIKLRRSGVTMIRSASNVRVAGHPFGASMLRPNNSTVNQLTRNSARRLPEPSAPMIWSSSIRTLIR